MCSIKADGKLWQTHFELLIQNVMVYTGFSDGSPRVR